MSAEFDELWENGVSETIARLETDIRKLSIDFKINKQIDFSVNNNLPYLDKPYNVIEPRVTVVGNYHTITISNFYIRRILNFARLFVKACMGKFTIGVTYTGYDFEPVSSHVELHEFLDSRIVFKESDFDLTELNLSHRIFTYMLSYAIFHELSHLLNGHYDYVNSNSFKNLTPEKKKQHNRAMEMDADAASFVLMTKRFTSHSQSERTTVSKIVVAAILIFILEGNILASISDEGSHPHPKTRIQEIFGLVRTHEQRSKLVSGIDKIPLGQFNQETIDRLNYLLKALFKVPISIISAEESAKAMIALQSHKVIWHDVYPHVAQYAAPQLMTKPSFVGMVPELVEYLMTEEQRAIYKNAPEAAMLNVDNEPTTFISPINIGT